MILPHPLYFNGKFYGAGLNGVHRVADRLIHACDRILAGRPAAERVKATVILPRTASWRPKLEVIEIEERAVRGQLWEQLVLPRLTRDGVLVNLANLSPIRHQRKVTLLHDVQFLFPDCSYPARQRIGYRWLTPRMARTSSAALTVSEYSRQMMNLFKISSDEDTIVLPNGADHILDQPTDHRLGEALQLSERGYVILFGSVKRYKNVQVIFDAFAGNALAPLRLVVIGPDRQTLVSGGLTPPADAIFAGSVDDGELRALFERAACLVFPSKTEGFGLPPLEAMLCGCPAVVAPMGAIPETCADAALYAGIDDVSAWREAIRALTSDEDLRAGKIATGRKRAARFTWDRAGAQLMQILDGMQEAA